MPEPGPKKPRGITLSSTAGLRRQEHGVDRGLTAFNLGIALISTMGLRRIPQA